MKLQPGSLIKVVTDPSLPEGIWGVFNGKDVQVGGSVPVHVQATAANMGAFVIRNILKEDKKMDARTHRTREGVELLIAEMDDEHLLNTINFWLSKLRRARAAVDAPQRTGFNKLLYRTYEQEDTEWAESAIEEFYIMAPRYFMEALLRDLDLNPEVRILQEVMGRSQRLMDRVLIPYQEEPDGDYEDQDL